MKEIKAREGYYLTQSEDVADRIFVTAIKGMNVNPNDWREATKDEKDAFEETQKEKKDNDELD
jgi:hypothetical protein